jgi:hypothetical protein
MLIIATILFVIPWIQEKSLSFEVLSTITGVIIGIFSIILIIDSLYTLGKPRIVISRKGITTPWSGFIAWDFIYGIHLKEIRHRGSLINHVLSYRIKNFKPPQTTSNVVKLLRRVKGLNKEKLSLRLFNTNEKPEVVYGLSDKLWRNKTGRNYEWSPDISDEDHDTVIRLDQRKMPTYEASPQEVHSWLKEQEMDFNKLSASLRKQRMTLQIKILFYIAIMVLFIAILSYSIWKTVLS